MKILFVQPGLIEITNEYPPIGVSYLASIVRNSGYSVDLYDAAAKGCSLATALEFAIDFQPDILCLSLYTIGISEQYKFLGRIKKAIAGCIVLIGGPHATALPVYTMEECQDIDFLVYGEGEKTIIELLSALRKEKVELRIIKGLCYRSNGKIEKNSARGLIKNLDEIPFPAYDLLKIQDFKYARRSLNLTDNVGVIFSSRGCPASCDFCFKATFGSELRHRSPQNVVAEMQWQMQKFGVEEFQFVDDLFAINTKWLNEFFDELDRQNIKVPWKCLARVNSIKKSDLKKMYEHGCYGVEFGVESGNDDILKDIGKSINTQQVHEAFKTSREIGLLTFGFFVLGLKKDTNETVKQTLELAKEISPDLCGFATLLPFPGSMVHSCLPENLKYDWDKFRSYYSENALPISLCSISPKELRKYREQAGAEVNGSVSFLFKNVIFRKGIKFSHRKELLNKWHKNIKVLVSRDIKKNRVFLTSKSSFAVAFFSDLISFVLFELLVGWWLNILRRYRSIFY